ncbi:MAG: hypothetical protein J1E06_08160 [Acutalibacter sp.]|nr:hypothetical protein [Acutalibacter sp.]
MKKVFSCVLCLALICAVFSACTVKRHEGESPVNSSTVNFSDSSAAGTDAEEKVIHLVTDFGMIAELAGRTASSEDAQLALEQALDYWGALPEGYRVEVEVLPTDDAEYESRLTRLKVEIMSGGGPDIYVMNLEDRRFQEKNRERLFPDAHKAMTDGFFLQLDDYVEHAEFMELEAMNPVVMDAGCTENGRFILPMRYSFLFCSVKEEPVGNTDVDWFTGVERDDSVLARAYAQAIQPQIHYIFEDTIDYETRSLTFTEEELYRALCSAFSKAPQLGGEWDYNIRTLDASPFSPELDGWFDPANKDIEAYFPMRNREGGVTASITSYVAVNRNTSYPEEAFHVADVMMSKQFQSGIPFWKEEKREDYDRLLGDTIAVFSFSLGVSVYDDLMTYDQPMLYTFYLPDETFPTYCELRDQITHVKFINVVDQLMDDVKYFSWMENMVPGDELEKYVAEQYRKMMLIVGEM